MSDNQVVLFLNSNFILYSWNESFSKRGFHFFSLLLFEMYSCDIIISHIKRNTVKSVVSIHTCSTHSYSNIRAHLVHNIYDQHLKTKQYAVVHSISLYLFLYLSLALSLFLFLSLFLYLSLFRSLYVYYYIKSPTKRE